MFKWLLSLFGLMRVPTTSVTYEDGILVERKRQQEQREELIRIEMESLLNKPVICVGNEWENPLIGVMVDIQLITKAQQPIPVIRDVITGKDVITFAKVMPFTIQRFYALMKLDAYERWCLIDINREDNYQYTNMKKKPKLLTAEEYLTILRNKNYIGLQKLENES